MKNSFVEFVTLFWLRQTVPLRLKEKICTVKKEPMKTIEAPFYIAGNKRYNTTNQIIFFAVKCSFFAFKLTIR